MFSHFFATEDSRKARSSLETKCKASQRMEGMSEDHEGILVGPVLEIISVYS